MTLHGPFLAWARYLGGSALFALAVVLLALAAWELADARRTNDALNDRGDSANGDAGVDRDNHNEGAMQHD